MLAGACLPAYTLPPYPALYVCWFFLQDGGKQLQEGMEENDTITHMDLRLTECGQESEYCINQILSTNREKERDRQLNKANSANKKG